MPPALTIVLSTADMSVLTECWPGPGRGRAQEVHQEDLCAAAGAGGQAGHAAQATRQAGHIITLQHYHIITIYIIQAA